MPTNKTTAQVKAQNGVTDAPSIIIETDQSIEMPTQELSKAIQEAAFMEEKLLVLIADSVNENDSNHVILSVNGVTQPVFRGVPTRVKRKYVEVLARCKETKITQKTENPNTPDRISMVERTALVYPFQVMEDPNPKGSAWLRAVLAERG